MCMSPSSITIAQGDWASSDFVRHPKSAQHEHNSYYLARFGPLHRGRANDEEVWSWKYRNVVVIYNKRLMKKIDVIDREALSRKVVERNKWYRSKTFFWTWRKISLQTHTNYEKRKQQRVVSFAFFLMKNKNKIKFSHNKLVLKNYVYKLLLHILLLSYS